MGGRCEFTIDDLPDLPDNGHRYEVIEGELYVTAVPHLLHQIAIQRLRGALGLWDQANARGMAVSGAGVIFSRTTAVVPDLLWVSAARAAILVDPATGQPDGKLHAAPDLVVEVVSPGLANVARDRETKRTLYGRRGVAEYWIVDRQARTIEVYRQATTTGLDLAATLTEAETLVSPLLPGFALPVATVFAVPAWLPL